MLASCRRVPQRSVAMLLLALFLSAQSDTRAAEQEGALGLEKTISLDLGNGVKMEFVLIPAGSFMMGNADGSLDQRPVHKVNITRPFYLGKYEVTVAQWEAVMGARGGGRFGGPPNPAGGAPNRADAAPTPASGTPTPPGGPSLAFGGALNPFNAPQNPVSSTWQRSQSFIKALNDKLAPSGGKVSLPTEAQWEYACRAGTTTKYSFANDTADAGQYAWFRTISKGSTHPVGEKKPNAWGLYDMHGNVWEWCADWYDKDYYQQSATDDPPGPSSGVVKVLRGGGWNDDPMYGNSTIRNRNTPNGGSNDQGFRLVYVR